MLWLPIWSPLCAKFAAAGPAELRGNSEKPPQHLWSENHSLTRRRLVGGKLAPQAVPPSCASNCPYLYRDNLWALGGS
jgi:hypothetical protein